MPRSCEEEAGGGGGEGGGGAGGCFGGVAAGGRAGPAAAAAAAAVAAAACFGLSRRGGEAGFFSTAAAAADASGSLSLLQLHPELLLPSLEEGALKRGMACFEEDRTKKMRVGFFLLQFFYHLSPHLLLSLKSLRRLSKETRELLPQPVSHLVPVAVINPPGRGWNRTGRRSRSAARRGRNQVVPHGAADRRRQPQLAVWGLLVDDVGPLPFPEPEGQDSRLRIRREGFSECGDERVS